jgi:hypothetical protein
LEFEILFGGLASLGAPAYFLKISFLIYWLPKQSLTIKFQLITKTKITISHHLSISIIIITMITNESRQATGVWFSQTNGSSFSLELRTYQRKGNFGGPELNNVSQLPRFLIFHIDLTFLLGVPKL